MTTDLGASALHYASIGWHVLPLWPGTKNPILPNGHLGASCDPATVAAWWQQYPDANIGLSLAASGLVAVDPDLYKPDCGWSDFTASHTVPDTLSQHTARGGRHYLFAAPAGASYAGKLCAGTEIKHNGYIVLAPSVAEGGAYRWDDASKQPAPAPAWLPSKSALANDRTPIGQGERAPSYDAAIAALHSIDVGSLTDRNEWLAVTGALMQSIPDRLEDAKAEWLRWNQSYPRNHEVPNLKAWADLLEHGTSVGGWQRLHREAYGQPDPAALFGAAVPQWSIPATVQPPAGFFSAADLAGQPVPPREWLVPELVPMNTVTLLGGDGGTGKSLLAMQLAVGVAVHRAWLGNMPRHGRALYLSAEDDRDELHRRLNDICRSMFIGLADLSGLTILPLAGEDALLAHELKGAGLRPSPLFQMIESRVAVEKPALIVLDTLADLFPSNENDRALVRQFVGILRGLAIRHGCAVVLLSHPSLTGMSNGTGASGSTAWNNSVRSRLYLDRLREDGFEPNPDARVLTTKKANYGRVGNEIRMTWRNGVFVQELGSSVADTTAKAEQVFLDLLRKFTEQGRPVNANGGTNYAPLVFSKEAEAKGMTKKAFGQAMSALLDAGKIRNVEYKRSTRLELVQ